jgi:hypothetical protein
MAYQPSTEPQREQSYALVAAALVGAALIAFLAISAVLEFTTGVDVPFVNWSA